MQKELIIAILGGLGGMFGWGFSEFATKKSVDKIGTISSLVWAHVLGTVILFCFLVVNIALFKNHVVFISSPQEWIGLIFFGTLQTIVYYFGYKGFEMGQVAILSPIFASFTVWVSLISVLVFGEVLTGSLLPSLALVFAGVILINLDIKGLRAKKVRVKGVSGLKEIIIATALATFWTLGWDKFTKGKDWILYTTFMFVFMTLSAYLLARLKKVNLSKIKPGVWASLWLIALGEAVAYLAISLGYSTTTYTSVVAILSGASSLPTIVLARIFLKEKMTIFQTIASLIIISGIALLSLR